MNKISQQTSLNITPPQQKRRRIKNKIVNSRTIVMNISNMFIQYSVNTIIKKTHKSQISSNNQLCSVFFSWKGTLTLTPGMGWVVPSRTPQTSPSLKQIVRTRIVHTSGHFSKNVKKTYLRYVSIHRKSQRIR